MKNSGRYDYQMWAKIGKDEEYYYIQDYFIITDDNLIKQAAEYIGMAQIVSFFAQPTKEKCHRPDERPPASEKCLVEGEFSDII